ncbi:MAG: hypothetical protein WCY16_03535 [Weeksellaceae bacterium]
MKKCIFLFCLSILFISCDSTKYISFTQNKEDIITNQNLKDFLKNNKSPKVVLRVPNSSLAVTDTEDNSYLFNAIENEFLANGFLVRDRQLFNQILSNSDNNVDYSVLRDKSDTDLIIELSQLKYDVLYETNKYTDDAGREKVENKIVHKRYGAMVEFKVIIVKNNEYAGVYRFNYVPCSDSPCQILSLKKKVELEKENKKAGILPYEGVEKNEMELFIKGATNKLIKEMRR